MNFWPAKQNVFYLGRKTTCYLSTTPQAHTWKEMFNIIQCQQQCFIRTGLPVHCQIPFQSRCKQPCSLSLSLSPLSLSPHPVKFPKEPLFSHHTHKLSLSQVAVTVPGPCVCFSRHGQEGAGLITHRQVTSLVQGHHNVSQPGFKPRSDDPNPFSQ